nr:DUF3108 domain-containing protein [uncultured Caldimonas sp.]
MSPLLRFRFVKALGVAVVLVPVSLLGSLWSVPATAAESAAAAPAAAAPQVPVYSTRLPPSFKWTYSLSRGALSGAGELTWRPQGTAYQLKLEGKVALVGTVLTQVSKGGLDANGIAPVRFTDRRLRRAEQAASFQRETGKITFSGRADEHPLVPGVQDRLSWMVQLPAIAQADPSRVRAGRTVVLMVVGARGDARVWTLRSDGVQGVRVEGRTVQAVKLVREREDPHDTTAEVWLDPQRHHLPVRARLTDGNSDALELLLQATR